MEEDNPRKRKKPEDDNGGCTVEGAILGELVSEMTPNESDLWPSSANTMAPLAFAAAATQSSTLTSATPLAPPTPAPLSQHKPIFSLCPSSKAKSETAPLSTTANSIATTTMTATFEPTGGNSLDSVPSVSSCYATSTSSVSTSLADGIASDYVSANATASPSLASPPNAMPTFSSSSSISAHAKAYDASASIAAASAAAAASHSAPLSTTFPPSSPLHLPAPLLAPPTLPPLPPSESSVATVTTPQACTRYDDGGSVSPMALVAMSAHGGMKEGKNSYWRACLPCHRAKTACDESRPCRRCVRLKIECATSAVKQRKVACVNCHKLKGLCDGNVPCSRCSMLGKPCELPPAARASPHTVRGQQKVEAAYGGDSSPALSASPSPLVAAAARPELRLMVRRDDKPVVPRAPTTGVPSTDSVSPAHIPSVPATALPKAKATETAGSLNQRVRVLEASVSEKDQSIATLELEIIKLRDQNTRLLRQLRTKNAS